jgi:hypothetical protein
MGRKKKVAAHSWELGCRCTDCTHKHYSELGSRGGQKNKARHGKSYFSKLAKKSHPVNNPEAQRKAYVGGRPRKDANVVDSPGTL